MTKVRFKEWDCFVVFEKYSTGNHAIQLIDADDGTPVATASVNVPELDLEPNEVVIKDYSENEGVYEALLQAGIVVKTKKAIQLSQHVIAPIAKIVFN